MTRLGELWGDRIAVECATCRRSGSYRIAGLLQRFGPEISCLDLLRALTTTCRYQRVPGAVAARKYEGTCLATLNLPKAPSLEPPVPPGVPFTIEVWGERGRIELRLAVLYTLDGALAAFDAVKDGYPKNEITLRQACRVIRKKDMPSAEASPDADPGGD